MAIRLRLTGTVWVALCAAETDAKPDDLYLDDGQHEALADKFAEDWAGQVVTWGACLERKRRMDAEKIRDAWSQDPIR